jgi:metal-sulfur cluster biosynthetic enzyme
MGSDEVSITRAGGFPSLAAVRRALQTVLDPELDQSLLELGFVDDVSVQEGHVTVVVRLPTAWCAPAFVYLMASDIRAALLALPGVTGITVRLPGYFAASAIEATVGRGGTFADAFPGEGSGRVEDLRRAFLRKGFLARQARILDALAQAGLEDDEICRLTVDSVALDRDPCEIARPSALPLRVGSVEPFRRYVAGMEELGFPTSAGSPLIVDAEGRPIDLAQIRAHRRWVTLVRLSLETNGTLCRALLAARTPPLENATCPGGDAPCTEPLTVRSSS